MDINFWILISALSFLLLYFAVRKISFNADVIEATTPPSTKAAIYPEFCELINAKIQGFKKQAQSFENALLDADKKDECLEKLGDLSRKLIFIQTMNLSKKSDEVWQNELFGFLKELESVVISYFANGDKLADTLRSDLAEEFKNLQKS